MNRREFIRRLEAVSAAGAAGAMSAGCIGFHYVSSSLTNGQVVIRRDAFGSSGFVLVDHPGSALPLFVRRDADGGFTAMSTRCMHRGCQVEPGDGKLVCPCHGSEYDLAGRVLKGPTRRPLQTFPVTADAQYVMIDLRGGEPS